MGEFGGASFGREITSESGCDQKGIGVAFFADAGEAAVTGIDDSVVGELHEFAADGFGDLFHGAAPEIGTADAAGEERVASKKARSRNGDGASVFREIEADAAGRVAGRVHYGGLE